MHPSQPASHSFPCLAVSFVGHMRYLQSRTKDVFHLHMAILERQTERLAEHGQIGKGTPHLHTPYARNFMENERQLSKK